MKKTGFYIIKDKFFEDMPDPYLKGNKAGNRPYYYCFEDNATGIYWMIPLSSRIDKFRKIIDKKEQSGKPCDILHIVKLDDSRESVFLIQDMEANGIGADLRKYAGQTKREIREVIARNKDFLKCITKPSSKYLGDAVDLNSSGDITND